MLLPLASQDVEAAAAGRDEAVGSDDVWQRRRERFLARYLAEEGRPMEARPMKTPPMEAPPMEAPPMEAPPMDAPSSRSQESARPAQQTRPAEPRRRSASAAVHAALAPELGPPCSAPRDGVGGACAGWYDASTDCGGSARGYAGREAVAAVHAHRELQPKTHAATAATRRRWFKVVAAVHRPSRGGSTARRYVDITDGCTEFLVARTSTHFDGSLSGLRELHDDDGFLVHQTEMHALAEDFPLDAKLLYAPRALLEVVTGGQPRRSTRGTHFFQIMPLCVIAEGRAFNRMHEEYFGDAYVYPVPFAIGDRPVRRE